jgi:ADP-ribose pyrophosphatase YjhB (NUDIX family)
MRFLKKLLSAKVSKMIGRLIGTSWRIMPAQLRRWITRRVQTTFTISAAGIITNAEGQVLLLNHILRSTPSGWGVPGGFISLGEQPEAALRREIREETGLALDDVRIFHCRTIYRHVEVIMTAKGVGTAKVNSREITELAWFSLEDIPAEMNKGEKDLIKAALSRSI